MSKKTLHTIIQFIIGAGFGAGGMLIYLKGREMLMIEAPGWIAAISTLLVVIFLTVLIHELGHLIAGKAAGFRFLMISVGPFKVQKSGETIRPGLNKHLNTSGGLTLMIPERLDPENSKMIWFIAAGPIANFILGAVTVSLAVIFSGAETTPGLNYALYFLFTTGIVSILLGLASIIPSESDAFESDGRQILDLLRGGDKAITKQRLTVLSVSILNGTRPRDIDTRLLESVLSRSDSQSFSQASTARFIAAYHHLDSGNIEAAEQIFDSLISDLENEKMPMLKGTLFSEKAFILSAYRHDAGAALPFLEKARKGYVEKQTLSRAEAAWHIAMGCLDDGIASAKQGLKEAPKSLDKGGAIFETEILHVLSKGELPKPVIH